MKKVYSAPIADLIETEMDTVLQDVSWSVIIDPDPDNPPGPGYGEVKPGDEGFTGNLSKSSSIFDE